MNIEVNRKTLLDALRFGGMVAGKCKTIPILDYCKVVVKGDKMVVTSTDTEVTIAKKANVVSCDAEQADFCVVPSDLVPTLGTIRDENVSLEVNENVCTLVHSRGTVKVAVLPTEDFPATGATETKTTFSMDATRLREWLDTAKSFVADDQLRPALTGMYLAVENGEVWAAASDSFKLFVDGYEGTAFEGINTSMIIPSKAFGYASSILDGYANTTVQVDDKNVSFIVSDAKISTRLIGGTYPKARAIIPKDNPIIAYVNTSDLAESLSRVKLFANKVSKRIALTFNTDGVKLTSEDLAFNKACEDSCDVLMYEGDNIEICAKDECLEAVLSRINTETTAVCMSNPTRPIAFYEADNRKKVFIVMPTVGN